MPELKLKKLVSYARTFSCITTKADKDSILEPISNYLDKCAEHNVDKAYLISWKIEYGYKLGHSLEEKLKIKKEN